MQKGHMSNILQKNHFIAQSNLILISTWFCADEAQVLLNRSPLKIIENFVDRRKGTCPGRVTILHQNVT